MLSGRRLGWCPCERKSQTVSDNPDVMNRFSESLLLDFCTQQRGNFEPRAWEQFTHVTPLELAATARYLAGVSWYGHSQLLVEIADGLGPQRLADLVLVTGFDPSRFAGLLKARLKHAGQHVAA